MAKSIGSGGVPCLEVKERLYPEMDAAFYTKENLWRHE